MNWLIKTFSSSIGQKILMALTGLFLSTFLVVHLTGNLQLLIDDEGYKFNAYAKFMTGNPLIKVASYITYLSILFHAFKGLWLASKNRAARPKGYKKYAGKANSTWMSRSMGVLGTIILVFIATHMWQFWYQYHNSDANDETATVIYQEYTTYETESGEAKQVSGTKMEEMNDRLTETVKKYQATNDQAGFEADPVYLEYEPLLKDLEYAQNNGKIEKVKLKDLYTLVANSYENIWIVLLYVVSMGAVGFHLMHGFSSAFQTMGWKHPKLNPLINGLTWFFGIIIPACFAAIPLIMYFS